MHKKENYIGLNQMAIYGNERKIKRITIQNAFLSIIKLC